VPGTNYRIGLDPILGLLPIVGDLISPLFTIGLLWQARELGVPKVVQARMFINVALDTFLGMVPVVGDLFDFAWKANQKNLDLLELHAREIRSGSAEDFVFVILMIVLVLSLVVVPFTLLGWLVATLAS
jgi:hypothetical protein